MAVRLDPFRQIVNVAWPTAATGPFVGLYTVFVNTPTNLGITFALTIHGNQTAAYFTSDRLRLTLADAYTLLPTSNPTVTFVNATSLPGGLFGHPPISTPNGYTVIQHPSISQPFPIHDSPPVLLEVLRAGTPILAVDVDPWSLYTFVQMSWPAVGTQKSFRRVK